MFINRSGLALGGIVVLGSSGVLAACGSDDKEVATPRRAPGRCDRRTAATAATPRARDHRRPGAGR